jgi:hypothetical protein
MGLFYYVNVKNVLTGAVADTYKTMIAVIVDATLGHRFRLRKAWGGCSEDSPPDLQIAVDVGRIEDFSAGGVGSGSTLVDKPNIARRETAGPQSDMQARTVYTGEPTTYDVEALFALEFNGRGGFVKEWSPDEAPVFVNDQVMGLRFAPRTAVARTITAGVIFETWF